MDSLKNFGAVAIALMNQGLKIECGGVPWLAIEGHDHIYVPGEGGSWSHQRADLDTWNHLVTCNDLSHATAVAAAIADHYNATKKDRSN